MILYKIFNKNNYQLVYFLFTFVLSKINMGFQIKTKEGDSLELRLLDQEAANFWGVEVDPKYYASPVKKLVKPESFANEEEKRNGGERSLITRGIC